MQITHVIHYFQPKLGYQEFYLAKKQKEQGHDVAVITSNKFTPFLNYTLAPEVANKCKTGKFIEEGITVYRLSTPIELKRRMWLLGLESVIAKLKPDAIHVHGIFNITAWRVAKLKKKLGFNLIYDSHMHYSIYDRSHLYMKIYHNVFKTFFIPKILKDADIFVGTCEETKHLISEEYGIPNDKIIVIPLGADVDLFKKDLNQRKKVRDQLNINPDEVVLIYAGILSPEKAPHLLLDASTEIIKENKKIKLLFVGNSLQEYIINMKKKVMKNKIEDNVIFCNAVSNKELYKYYSVADIGVWPAQESLTMIEAAATGLPIIIKQSVAMEERVSNKNGLVYKEGNVANLRRCVLQLLNDEKLRREMGERGRELVEKKFSWEVISKQFVDVYKNPERYL